MQVVVSKSLLQTIKDVLNSLSQSWAKMIDKLGLDDVNNWIHITDIKKDKKTGNMSVKYIIADPDNPNKGIPAETKVTVTHDKSKAKVELYIDGVLKESKTVNNDDDEIQKVQNEWILSLKKVYGENFQKVKSCKSLKFTVTRTPIKGSKDDSINLTSINANFELGEAIENMEEILASQEVLALMLTSDTPYMIEALCPECQGDTCNVQVRECPENLDCQSSFSEMLCELHVLENNVRTIRWNLAGLGYDKLIGILGDMQWRISTDIDGFADMYHSKYKSVPNLLLTTNEYASNIIPGDTPMTIEEAKSWIQSMLTDYMLILNTLYVNFDISEQAYFAEALRAYKGIQSQLDRMFTQTCTQGVPQCL